MREIPEEDHKVWDCMHLLLLKESFYVKVVIMKKVLWLCSHQQHNISTCEVVKIGMAIFEKQLYMGTTFPRMHLEDSVTPFIKSAISLTHCPCRGQQLTTSVSISRVSTQLFSIHSSCSSLLFFSMFYLELRVELKGMCCELIQ